MSLTIATDTCIMTLLTLLPFLVMAPENNDSNYIPKENLPLDALVEASCAPMFSKIKNLLEIDLTTDRIIQFAELHKERDNSVPLAIHICNILLSGIRNEQNGTTYIHTTSEIRQKIREILESHAPQSQELIELHRKYNLTLTIQTDLLKLAKEFLSELLSEEI